MMDLSGKRILFFSAKLFGYENEIKEELEKMGALVDYFDERPANSFLVKALIRINRNFLGKYINNYHSAIVEQTQHHPYDFIFITKAEAITEVTLQKLRQLHPSAKFIIYHWDSIAYNRYAKKTLSYFDTVFSFDRNDCQLLNLKFLPLFYLPEYERLSADSSGRKGLLFIGTAHSDRYALYRQIEQSFLQKGYPCFSYFYFPSPILYFKTRLFDRSIRATRYEDFHYKALSKADVLGCYQEASIVLDIHRPNQMGLTMRTIEVLGAKKKLITTNADIVNYDFYDPNNILLIDRHKPIIPDSFLQSDYQEIAEDIYRRYSLHNWLRAIFLGE